MKSNIISLLLLMLVTALFHLSCNQNKTIEKDLESWDVKNTMVVESYDEINAPAIKKAQDSLGFFIKSFKSRKSSDNDFFIKSKFTDGKSIENMWSIVNSIQGDSLLATLDNVPLRVNGIKLNDKIKIAKKDIEDWNIYQGDSLLFGNFIVRNPK